MVGVNLGTIESRNKAKLFTVNMLRECLIPISLHIAYLVWIWKLDFSSFPF